jgi:Arc/MetJ-type ribon-helix-helix transcriptional regulator
MFSNWFSGDDLGRYQTSPHKQRIDAIASSLLRLKYASEVIRQHLHEWLRSLAHSTRKKPRRCQRRVRNL